MTPWILVALLGGLILGWVGRSVRAAGREWILRSLLADAEVQAAAATFALAQERDYADDDAADAWDAGWQNGVGIRVDLGGIEP
jgi:hypothetical protein